MIMFGLRRPHVMSHLGNLVMIQEMQQAVAFELTESVRVCCTFAVSAWYGLQVATSSHIAQARAAQHYAVSHSYADKCWGCLSQHVVASAIAASIMRVWLFLRIALCSKQDVVYSPIAPLTSVTGVNA